MLNRLANNLRRLGSQAQLTGLLRSRVPGLLAVLCFCGFLLVGAFQASDRYYERHLVAADTSYYLMSAALLVSGKNDFKLAQILADPAPFHAPDGGTQIYVLQTLVAWCLRSILPLRPAMAVILNGIWLAAMAVSVYTLLWSRIGRWTTSAVATVAFVVANPFLSTITYGVTSMDPNLVGFMLGTSALCCTVLSDRFQRLLPSLFAGFFLGTLCLGRVYTLGVVAPAMLPYVLSCFWRRSRGEMLASLRNGALALAVTFSVSGWFLIQEWTALLKYPTQYGSAGILNHSTLAEGLKEWLEFPKLLLSANVTLLCVLSWPLAATFFDTPRRLRDFNWSALAAVLGPLVVLAKMGTTFQPYGSIVLFGIFMLALFPFGRPTPALLHRGRFAAALWCGCAFSCWSFFAELREVHHAQKNNKSNTVAALESMRDHAVDARLKQVTLGLVHWGTLHDAALIDALIFDLGVRVATPAYQPKRRRQSPLIVEPLMTDLWAWDAQVSGAAVLTPESWAKRVIERADYAIVLSGTRTQDRRHGRWPQWVEASEQIKASGIFTRLGSPFKVPADGSLELLARKELRRP